MNMLQMIAELRGGIPECCDFCDQEFTEERYPTPEEAGMWACIECVERWAREDAERTCPNCDSIDVTIEEHLTGEGAMEYVEWYDCTCNGCGEKWTASA